MDDGLSLSTGSTINIVSGVIETCAMDGIEVLKINQPKYAVCSQM